MSLYSVNDAQLAFGHVPLLDHAHFSLEKGERVGLIGRNGAGKSSLLKVMAGILQLDDGLIQQQKALHCVYVAQETAFADHQTVGEVVAQGVAYLQAPLACYMHLTEQLADHAPDAQAELLEQIHSLQTFLDMHDAWNWQAHVAAWIEKIKLSENEPVDRLSGGMKKRVALAQAFVAKPDILLLDEPTNHLDYESIVWLENFLLSQSCSMLFVTHDRAFLDRIATRIIELDRGRLLSYPGNFSAYQQRKAEQLEVEAVEQRKFDQRLAQEEIWMRKGVEARRTKSVSRISRLVQMREQRQARRLTQSQVKLDIHVAEKSGKMVADLEAVSLSFAGRCVIDRFSTTIMRGDKIGLIGANGTGKSSLLKLILGELQPDQGRVRLGTQLQVAYYDQMRNQLQPEASLIETISPGSEWIEINGKKKHVMRYLADFLFAPERAHSPVSTLSGGERNRLLLARLFAQPSNVLVLDEPTNDLDIAALELLEDLLMDYSGTVLLVSHDRAFIDQVVTSVIVAQGDGQWREFIGGFSDWQRQVVPVTEVTPSKERKKTPRQSTKAVKFTFHEQRELEALPGKITQLETEQKTIETEISSGQIFVDEPEKALLLTKRLEEIEAELMSAFARWEALEQKQLSGKKA